MERHTKVNRSITEGRASFFARVQGIQSGAECERLAPLLSALADGEATAEDVAALRPHLRGCLACRATLRDYRAAPRQVAALLPAPALLAGNGGSGGWLESLLGAVSDRGHALALKAQTAVEIASAQKVAAMAASTAVLAGGGAATVATLERPERPAPRAERAAAAAAAEASTAPAPPRATPAAPPAERRAAGERRRRARRKLPEQAAPAATEFDPTGNPETPATPAAAAPAAGDGGAPPPPDPANAEFAP